MNLANNVESRLVAFQTVSFSELGAEHEMTTSLGNLLSDFNAKKEGLSESALEDINNQLIALKNEIFTKENAKDFQANPELWIPYLQRIVDNVPKVLLVN